MNMNEMLLQMVYAASQIAQSTLPPISNNNQQSGETKDFHSLLSEKRTQAEEKDTQSTSKTQAPQQETQQPAAQTDAAAATQSTAAAFAQQMAMQPVGMMDLQMQANVTNVPVENAVQAVPTLETALPTVPQTVAETPVQAQVLPTTVETTTPAAAVAVPVQTEQEGDGQTVSQAETAPLAVQAQAETETVQLTQPQQELGEEGQAAAEQNQTAQKTETEVLEASAGEVSQPLFQDSDGEAVFHRVGDAPVLDTQSGEMEVKLTSIIQTSLEDGGQHLSIKLSPEQLGNVVVEMTRSPEGVLHVILHTETEQAAKLLSEHSGTLGLMLQNSQQGEVRVEVPRPNQSEQPWQQPDQNGGQNQQESRQQQGQNRQDTSGESFLQQLRLGLLPVDTL